MSKKVENRKPAYEAIDDIRKLKADLKGSLILLGSILACLATISWTTSFEESVGLAFIALLAALALIPLYVSLFNVLLVTAAKRNPVLDSF